MAAYATVSDVLARAGKFSNAWSSSSPTTTDDIERFLEDVAALIDVAVAEHGIGVPITSDAAVRALRGLNADGALILALEATFPGDRAPSAAQDLITRVEKRYSAALGAVEDGSSDVIQLLVSSTPSAAGASSLWTSGDLGPEVYDPYFGWLPSSQAAAVKRGMAL